MDVDARNKCGHDDFILGLRIPRIERL